MSVDWFTGVWPVLVTRVPIVICALLLLTIRRDTRAIAAGATPLVLSLFLLAQHKHVYYFVHELSLFTAGVWSIAATLAMRVCSRAPVAVARVARVAVPSAIAVALLTVSPRAHDVQISSHRRVHEGDVARAAGLDILGPSAVVGGRTGAWYIGGARHWLGLEQSSIWAEADELSVFERLDAAIETMHMSNARLGGTNGPTLSGLYASDKLRLLGFYIASANPSLSYVLLGTSARTPVIGYASLPDVTFKISEDARGSHFLVTAVCTNSAWNGLRESGSFMQAMVLPGEDASAPYIVTAVSTEAALAEDCEVLHESRVIVTPIDVDALLARASRFDGVMRFYRQAKDLPPRHPPHVSPPSTESARVQP
jgi:hypothetical protein